MKHSPIPAVLGVLGLIGLLVGNYYGLFRAPSEQHMGEVYRIMYIHVPTAWSALMMFTAAMVVAILSLWTGKEIWDQRLVGTVEVAAILTGLLLVQGSIWAKPTWGVWWIWDVRLTTSAIQFLLLLGILALRTYVADPDRRATWSAVVTIIAAVDIPIVYFCVKVMRSVHQVQSSSKTLDPMMFRLWFINFFAILCMAIWATSVRTRIEIARASNEAVPQPPARPVVQG